MNETPIFTKLLNGFLELDPLWRILICAVCALIAIGILVLIIVRAKKSDKRVCQTPAQSYVPAAQSDFVQSTETEVTASMTTGEPADAEIIEQGIFIKLVPEAPLEVEQTEYTLFHELTVGRDEENDIVLDDCTVSAHHAHVFFENGAVYIEDCGSTNGTAVEGMRIYTSNRLTSGDLITAGSVSFRLRF